jgi:ribosomal protein L24
MTHLVPLLQGKDKGQQGVVKKVVRKENRVIVEG